MSGGGSLGLGKSKSDSSSYGYSTSEAGQTSRSFSDQNIAFEDLYSQLYGGASGAAGTSLMRAPELTSTARQLFTGGSQFLDQLGGNTGSNYLEARLSGSNPVLDEQISQLSQDTGRFFTEQLNPAITSRAVAGGTLGGGRQGVAQGLAAEAAAQQFTRGATALRANDINQRDAAAMSVAQNSIAAASTGLGALPSLLDLVERGNNAELGTYASLSQILGGPTVLTESGSAADAFSRSFGQESSKSRGRAWNFNTAFGGGVGV